MMQLTSAHEHFLTMLGWTWERARLGGLVVHLTLEDGEAASGVPLESVVTGGDEAIDDTGVQPLVLLGGRVVDPLTVESYSVTRPAPPGA